MKIGIIGAGNVGGALGTAMARAGHEVAFGVRDPSDAKHDGLRSGRARVVSVRDAVEAADVVLLTTPWNAAQSAIESAGDLAGKTLVDATNPIGPGFALTHGHTDSGGEQVARWAKNAKVVKAFNTTGYENMANPVYGDRRVVMPVCGDDDASCELVATLAADIGFEALRVGGLSQARLLEPMAMVWIRLALVQGYGRDIAFGLLRR